VEVNEEYRTVKLSEIEVGERARKDYGDLKELASNLKKIGTIQPLVCYEVDGKLTLLAGGRRLEALKQLKQSTAKVRIVKDELSEEDRLTIELSENLFRKDMDWKEQNALKRKIHELQEKKHGKAAPAIKTDGWSQEKTAGLLGISVSSVRQDLALADAMEQCPELFDGCKTKSDAAKRMKKVGELITRKQAAEAYNINETPDYVKKQLINSYVVGDFFEGIKNIPNDSVDMIELDPPYAIEFNKLRASHSNHYTGYKEIPKKDYSKFLRKTFEECFRVARSDSWIVVWHSLSHWNHQVNQLLEETGWKPIHSPGVWVKAGTGGYSGNPEIAFGATVDFFTYARKGEATLNRKGRAAHFTYPIVPFDKRYHPTERPIELLKEILDAFVKPNSLILCPFLGSGNTILAAHEQLMKCTGWELEESCKDGYVLRVNNSY